MFFLHVIDGILHLCDIGIAASFTFSCMLLTACAVLVFFDVLNYSDDLLKRLRASELVSHQSDIECEIRGNTIWSVEVNMMECCQY